MPKLATLSFLQHSFQAAADRGVNVVGLSGGFYITRRNEPPTADDDDDDVTRSWLEKHPPMIVVSHFGAIEQMILRGFCGAGWTVSRPDLSMEPRGDERGMYLSVHSVGLLRNCRHDHAGALKSLVEMFLLATTDLPGWEENAERITTGATLSHSGACISILAGLADWLDDPVLAPINLSSINMEGEKGFTVGRHYMRFPKGHPHRWIKDETRAPQIGWPALMRAYSQSGFELMVYPRNLVSLMAYALRRVIDEKVDLKEMVQCGFDGLQPKNRNPNGILRNETCRRAYELIKAASPGITCKDLAKALNVEEGYLRSKVIPVLKATGVVNRRTGDGYTIDESAGM